MKLEWTRWPTGTYAILPPDTEGRCACYGIKPDGRRGYLLWWFPLDESARNLGHFNTIADAKAHAQRQQITVAG